MVRRKKDMTPKDKPAGGVQDQGTPGQDAPGRDTREQATPGYGTPHQDTQDSGTPAQRTQGGGPPGQSTPSHGTQGQDAPRQGTRGIAGPGALPDRPTINDIARFAAVSKKTVSRVLNKSPFVAAETREKIEAIIARTSYSPDPQARGLAFRRSFLVGIVFDNPNPQYVVNMQQGILDGLRGSAHELVIHPCDRTSRTHLADIRNFVERLKLFGVILTPSVSEDEQLARMLEQIKCSYVRIASVPLDRPERMVVSHDRKGAAQAAVHLTQLGHRRIGFISGPSTFRSSHERRAGLEDGLAVAGLQLLPDLVAEGAYTFASGAACGSALLGRSEPPTAIFCANDEMACGLLQAARRAGVRVPADLSVVGFDDFQVATQVFPTLTTLHSPIRAIGSLAAQKLFASADARMPVPDSAPVPELVVRESTGPVRSP
jgi:LacI family transcriptional regulator